MNKKSADRQLRKQARHRLKPVYAAVLLAISVQTAQANPLGGNVTSGSASFATSGNTLTVTNTPGTIINWQGFSIGSSEVTHFAQQSASSTVLNRVVGNDPSNILGKLSSNGRVFLVNPNGILFGAGSVVDVAGLVASTLNLSDADFRAGSYHFTAVPGAANLSNAGNIGAQQGGEIYLIAPNVENTGIITAPNGEILLAAGASVDLVNTNDPNLRVSITAPAGDVTNIGQLIASSGSLGLFGTVVRNSGAVSADSATMQGGKIVFKASQRVEAGGSISAQGNGGGTISLLADMQDGTVNVTGTLDASAPVSGNGGSIDTSAAHVQVADSAHITTAARHGNSGNWLIDPTDFVIAAADPLNGSSYMSNSVLSSSLNSGNVTIQTLASGTGNGDIFVNDAVSWNATTNLTLNAIRNVQINAAIQSGGALQNPGSLTVRADLNGTGVGTILFGASGGVSLQGGTLAVIYGAANLIYNPTSYTSPTDFSGNVNANLTAWMLVNNATQLQAMNTNLTGAYALGKNIDASAIANFTPVGNGSFSFDGRFNGLGHTIDKLTINSAGGDAGLFGVLGAGGLVASVGLTNSSVTAAGSNVGALVGNNAGTIYNSYVSNGTVNVPGAYGGIGGLVGNNSGTISNSYVSGGSVTGQYYRVGGLVGSNSNNLASISNSYVIGTSVAITGSGAGFGSAGGLVGYNIGNISSSYVSSGNVSGFATVTGGVVGYNDFYGGGVVSNTYWDSTNAGAAVLFGIGYDPSIFGGTNTGAVDVAAAPLASTSYTGLDFVNTWWISEGNTRPFLQSEWNTNINNSHQLQLMAMDVTASYTLDANIDMSETASGSGMWGSTGFVPIGAVSTSNFSGQFDGRVHTISGLTINRPTDSYVGLFGFVNGSSSGVKIQNVGLVGANITGLNSVGGLAGENYYATISNSYASNSSVSGIAGSAGGGSNVGGLVGYNNGTINSSYASGGTVTGTSYVGGLVGYNGTAGTNTSGMFSGRISNSYVDSGSVTGTSNYGGLVGANFGLVSNSHYDITNVLINGQHFVTLGGLYNDTVTRNGSGQFSDWLNSGKLLNIANYASLPGSGNSYTIKDLQGMKDLLGFTDNKAYTFNLSANIDLTNLPDYYIPYLAGHFNGANFTISNLLLNQSNDSLGMFGYIAASGTVDKVIVSNASVTGGNEIGALAGSNYGTISYSKVLSSHVSGSTAVGGLAGSNYGTISYSGTINYSANDGSVTGSTEVGGLVGYNRGSSSSGNSKGGTIIKSYVTNGNVSGSTTGSSSSSNSFIVGGVGGLVGYTSKGTISGSRVDGSTVVQGWKDVGGLIGYDSGEGVVINNTVTATTVSGNNNVGGLVGRIAYSFNAAAYYDNNHVINAIVGGNNDVGGLAGWNGVPISNSSVIGTQVDGYANVGGLVGYNGNEYTNSYSNSAVIQLYGGRISSSFVDGGTVTANSYVGGLVGYNDGVISSNSHVLNFTVSSTATSSAAYAGGLVGYNNGKISGSYASTGTVSGIGTGVGGLVGYNYGYATTAGVVSGASISNSFVSNGTVSGSSQVGGLAGYNGGTIVNTYVSGGTVSGSSAVGGLVGSNYGNIGTSYASTGVVGISSAGGLVGYNAAYGGSVGVTNSFWNTTAAGTSVSSGIGSDAAASYAPSNLGATGMNTADMMKIANFNSATAANGNVNPNWDISGSLGSGSVWYMVEGVTMPLLSSFISQIVPVLPTEIDQIIYLLDQRKKSLQEALASAEGTPGSTTQTLPMCN